ncbi:MAG: radical SAM protein [Pyrinomonadaceae bacterium]
MNKVSTPASDSDTITADATPAFRVDQKLHQILYKSPSKPTLEPAAEEMTLPEPPYPLRPDPSVMTEREYQKMNAIRTWKTLGKPYFQSRWHSKELRPLIPYLFTDWKCNYDCHYCWSYNNKVKGMNEDVAKRSIDWLHSIGSRLLALMGGEPLVRPKFIHKIVYYSAKKGIFVYLPTNGRLMTNDVIDRLGDAGIANVNLAVDSVKFRKQLPKSLDTIRPQFEYLVSQQRKHGYTVMFNINITRINHDDVRELTQIGHDMGIACDYHINETPMMEQTHFKHLHENDTYLRSDDWDKVDGLLDWIEERRDEGYKIINPKMHIVEMRKLMRGAIPPWDCRAGQNSLIIRTDGTLAPCFPMYSATHDWGTIENSKFEVKQLDEMKKECSKHCLSTCNYILGYCYNTSRVIKWGLKQAMNGFRGATGSF